MDSLKRWFKIQQMPFFFVRFFINILLFLPILFCHTVSAQNLVNLGIVGQWNNDYGSIKAVKVLESNDLRVNGETEVKYVFCATSKGIVIFDIKRQTVISFIPMDGSNDIAIERVNNKGQFYLYAAAGEAGLYIMNVDNPEKPYYVAQCDTPGSAEGVVIEGDYAYVAYEPNGLLKFNIDKGYSLKGNLILVAGGDIDYKSPYWHATQILANQVFNTFINQGYEIYEIYYINPISIQDIDKNGIPNQPAVDDPTPTSAELKDAITKWAANQIANTGPLFIYLIGHGAEDRFQIMPYEVITAKELKESINKFQKGYTDDKGIFYPGTNRQVVVIIDSAASGTFIDNLLEDNVTRITSTGGGPSYMKPDFSDPNSTHDYLALSGQLPKTYKSFTRAFINALGTNLNTNNIPDNNPDTVNAFLKEAFITARNQLEEWGLSGLPFADQAPQMAFPGNIYTALNFSKDGINPIDYLSIDQNSPYYLTIIGQDPNSKYIPLISQNITFFSSDPDILNTNKTKDIEKTIDPNGIPWFRITPDIKITIDSNGIPWYSISPKKNGLFTLIGYTDPERNPTLLLSAKLTIEVSIDDPSYVSGKGKIAVIMAGYKGSSDYLWESTNNIGNHAYQTLRAMGYARGEIYYYNPYLLQDIDGEKGYDEIRCYPHLGALDPYIPFSPFEKIRQSGATELLLFFVDHGTQDKFYLNPKEILSASHLINQMTEISDQVDEKIVFLYDACYSGSFLHEIEKADPDKTLADKLITITSTDPDQTAYYLNQGMVSFSYPFFDEWSLTHSLLAAFDYAKEVLPLKGQTPCISDPNRIRSWDQQKIYYVDESRPVIDEVNAYRSEGKLHISARVYSMKGISDVWAIVESTQYTRKSSFGEAITEALELHLSTDPNDPFSDPNIHGGYYKLITPDPCPNETNYILHIYAADKSKRSKTVSYKTAIDSMIVNKTMALIIASSPDLFPKKNWYELERLEAQVRRAEAILKTIGLEEEDIIKITNKNDLMNIHALIKDKTLFIYIIGQVKFQKKGLPYFCLGPNENLYSSDFEKLLPQNSDQRFLLLMDTPYARQFLSYISSNVWSENWACIASTSQKSLFFSVGEYEASSTKNPFPCFSNLFFSGLLSGATVAQAYHAAKDAVSIIRQSPELLPKQIKDYQIINHKLDYYLGIPSIPREDYSLFIDCSAKVEEKNEESFYTLSLNPHPKADMNTWGFLTSSPYYFDQNSMLMNLEPYYPQEEGRPYPLFSAYVPWEREYYKAFFIVEGNIEGGPNVTWTEWQEVPIAQPSTDIGEDDFEPDDDTNIIRFDPLHEIIANVSPSRHTFYCPDYMHDKGYDDIDWVYFYAREGYIYEIHAQDLSEYDYFIQISLYDSDIMPVCDANKGHYLIANNDLTFICRKNGYYLIEAKLASSYPQEGVGYILSLVQINIGIGEDVFEPDDDPNIILYDAVHKIITGATQRHTFYCSNSVPGAECHDIDWVYFYALEGCTHRIDVKDTSGYNSRIQLTLHDSDFMPICDPNTGQCPEGIRSILFDCQESGHYFLEAKLVSGYPQEGVEYILSSYIVDPNLPAIGFKASISGRVIDSSGVGINALRIQITGPEGLYAPPTLTVSILNDSGDPKGGYFYIPNITVTSSPLNLEVRDYNDPNILLHPPISLPQLKPNEWKKLPNITLTEEEDEEDILEKNYFDVLKKSGFNVAEFPPQEDYDGDRISNWDEVLFYWTDPIKPTVSVSLSKGMNLYYFPSIADIPNILTNSLISIKDYFYYLPYDPNSQNWKSSEYRLKPNCFNAIHIDKPGVLYLNLISENRRPVLSLKRFLELSYSGFESLNPVNFLGHDLFDPNCFDLDIYTLTILDNPNLANIQMISGQNSLNGKWESSYRFFEKTTGKDICIKPHEVYIVTKSIEEI